MKRPMGSAIDDLKRAKALELRGFAYQHRIELSQTYGDLGRIEEEIAEAMREIGMTVSPETR